MASCSSAVIVFVVVDDACACKCWNVGKEEEARMVVVTGQLLLLLWLLLGGVVRETVDVELVVILLSKGLERVEPSGEKVEDEDKDKDGSRRGEVDDADGWTVVALARNF